LYQTIAHANQTLRLPADFFFVSDDDDGDAALIELAQNLHHLETGLCLDVMLFPVPVHYNHPRH